jgi:hypothetical protein
MQRVDWREFVREIRRTIVPMEAKMLGQIEAAERHAVEERWNEEARCALEGIISATQDRIKETRALIAKIDEILAKRR